MGVLAKISSLKFFMRALNNIPNFKWPTRYIFD